MTKCCGKTDSGDGPCAWFDRMIDHCYEYAVAAKAAGRPVVGILCEYTPRELIMAAGGVPVCLCGGSAKTIPAAEQHLPANLCPLIKSTYGYHVLRGNPFLEMADLVVGETTCDGKKKMYELMAETRPMYILELPHKSDDQDALEYWVRELDQFRTFLAGRFGADVSDDKIREAIGLLNRERRLRRELAALMKSDRPPLSGRQVLDCKSSIWAMPAAIERYECILAKLGAGAVPENSLSTGHPPALAEGTVRVLMTGVPMVRGAERVLDIVEQSGGLVVAAENCTGLKPLLEDVDEAAADPLRALAEKYFHLPCSVMTPNDRRLDILRQLAADYQAECVIELVWQACLTYDVESHRVRRFVEEQLGLPYLHIETDYSPSDSTRIALRVEALLETVRGQRSAAEKGTGPICRNGPTNLRSVPGAAHESDPSPFSAWQLMNAIAYSSPFVPAEWIAAHGLRPHGLRLRTAEGLTRGICPYAGALMDAVLVAEKGTGPICRNGPTNLWSVPSASHKLDLSPFPRDASALVLTTVCDQMRYVAALLEKHSRCPVFLLNVPSTWQSVAARRLYLDEIRRLGDFLVRLGGKTPSREDLSQAMLAYERERDETNGRGQTAPGAAALDSTAIPLAVLGGPLLDSDCGFFDLVERAGGRVVLDATEGAERTLPRRFDPARLASDPLQELADAYFDGIPDAFRRPNSGLYQWLSRELTARHVRGIIFRRYLWCDLWHAEFQRLKEWSPVPVLEIDVGPDETSELSRTLGRIEAFLEMLK